ncbi:uracil-DNA glycosylase [Dissulfuribacter thermophilus]|uniref:Uracil-DNA glycosylase n=1 Tax=Dissulfuribacter thermophilus TaxID=1156395 RepID=A0A1B9F5F3_9BACT|nr:uracil-DNA glycosylase [Dissulfuribacter thermophilus]
MDRQKCLTCKYYYITWDKFRPYGCKAFGFKSRKTPWLVVKESSGKDCTLYEPKPIRKM